MSGVEACDLLSAMETELNVDMSDFDSHDCISRDYMAPADFFAMFCFMFGAVASVLVVKYTLPNLQWFYIVLIGALGAFLTAWVSTKFIRKEQPKPELRVRDLVRAVEAKRWVSQKSV